MAKLDYQKLSRQTRLQRQPNINFDKTTHQSKLKKLWHQAIESETKFLTGKYQGKEIMGITQVDPKYCLWILDNQPGSITAKQLIKHYNRT